MAVFGAGKRPIEKKDKSATTSFLINTPHQAIFNLFPNFSADSEF